MSAAAKARAKLLERQPIETITDASYLSTGSTVLNLACTGRPDGGFLKGHYIHFVGDSNSGKTFLTLTCMAEAAANPAFKGYRLIYDAPEFGALMDMRRFFGSKMAERLEAPEYDAEGRPVYSETSEGFYYHVDDALKAGKPFIYVLDSQDSLSSKAEIDKFRKNKRVFKRKQAGTATEDDKAKGSYGDGKAKAHSSDLRQLMGPLQRSGSILIIISQTRDSFSMFESGTYSGGRALKFYATFQLWSQVAGQVEKTVKGKKRQLGIIAKVRVKKNRATGRDRSVRIPILHSTGIDEVGGCVDYLCGEGYWDQATDNGPITVRGLGPEFSMKRDALINKIETEGLLGDLRGLVADCWNEIEEACKVKRQPRYE